MTDQPPPPNPPTGPGEPGPSDPLQPGATPTSGAYPGQQPGWDAAQGGWGQPAGQLPAGPPPGWGAPQGGWGQPAGWGDPQAGGGSQVGPPPQGWGDPQAGWGPQAGPPPQGWVFPPTGGYPPGAGPYGGQYWYPGPQVGWYPPGIDPNDPLVTPPGAGLPGWLQRFNGGLRRGWRQLVPILLLTQVLPAAALAIISLALDPSAGWDTQPPDPAAGLPDNFGTELLTFAVVLIVGSLLIGAVQAIGWAAGSWVITQQAAGRPASLDAALGYGVRRALGLWGWTLVTGLLVGVGICLCVLPGIYLAFALSMAGPVYLFERQNPIGRSFRMFHDRFGMMLGRVALVGGVVLVVSLISGALESVGTAPFGTDPFGSPGSAVGVVVVIAVTSVLALPAYLVQLVGLLVTYTEQRAHEGPVNSAGLAAELG
ncbi:hypothetical protein Q3V37_09220 [Micromonospora profundi]|uniref:Glycerophosphoryl diester phosphodiesterase membrane domain-containing protein n=1 Tax=Micromonospora profundi TaxID=1420889 RepID=A0AAJ6L5L9_9ACTN|nr:hypothetical protein [Micromonospora profundi]WLS47386.1 hypothetical protein Q3V37_09220 [Micromonospora profundi]